MLRRFATAARPVAGVRTPAASVRAAADAPAQLSLAKLEWDRFTLAPRQAMRVRALPGVISKLKERHVWVPGLLPFPAVPEDAGLLVATGTSGSGKTTFMMHRGRRPDGVAVYLKGKHIPFKFDDAVPDAKDDEARCSWLQRREAAFTDSVVEAVFRVLCEPENDPKAAAFEPGEEPLFLTVVIDHIDGELVAAACSHSAACQEALAKKCQAKGVELVVGGRFIYKDKDIVAEGAKFHFVHMDQ